MGIEQIRKLKEEAGLPKAQKKYVSNNPEKIREIKRKCQIKTKDKIAEYKKARYKHFRSLGYSAKQASSM